MAIDASTVHLHRFMSAPYRVIEEDFLNVPLECHADLLHARYVLIHNQQSEAILEKIRASVKPGSYAVLEEPDFTSATLPNASVEPVLQRVNQAICRMFLEAGLDPGYGIGLPRRMAKEGFDSVCVSSTMHLYPGLGPVANLMAASAACPTRTIYRNRHHDGSGYRSVCDMRSGLGLLGSLLFDCIGDCHSAVE